ncbi:MAG: hypothetical protein GXP55_11300, partial [Deltaproteobacteria bacterium]|nr:hypothetical protein [Deltaproteobacteria bacterium]
SDGAELRFAALAALRGAEAAIAGPRLSARLEDADPAVRAAAAEGLGALDSADAAIYRDALRGLLADPVVDVGRTAALALAEFEDPSGVDLLVDALVDRRFSLDAAEALGRLKAQEAREPLTGLLHRRLLSPALHAESAGALCRLGSDDGVEGLRRVLRAFRPDGRSRAAELAGELGLHELIPELRRLLRRPRGADLQVVEDALSRLTRAPEPAKRGYRLQEDPGV